MSQIESKFGFIAWCMEDTHDKVWGYFYRPTPAYDNATDYAKRYTERNVVRFWGRRGKSMQFKPDVTGDKLVKVKRDKLNDGYEQINEQKLFAIWPNFIEEAEAKLMWDVLAGKVK